jgi:hypothetical protein
MHRLLIILALAAGLLAASESASALTDLADATGVALSTSAA